MKEQKYFMEELDRYYNHLMDRFDKGFRYVDSTVKDERGTIVYTLIIDELLKVSEFREQMRIIQRGYNIYES